MGYEDHTTELVSRVPALRDRIYSIIGIEGEEELRDLLHFYEGELVRHYNYGTDPSYLFVENDISINACACRSGDVNIVGINIGTFAWLKTKTPIAATRLSNEIPSILPLLNSPVDRLVHDFAAHFTFYHELGHLVQQSNLLETQLQEQTDHTSPPSRERHILEIDADEFSALCLGSHLLQYSQTILPPSPRREQIEELSVLGCASVMLHFMSFPSSRRPMYYHESSHPHPIIRITFIVLTILNYFTQALQNRRINISFDINAVVRKTILAAQNMAAPIFEINPLDGFLAILAQERRNITRYIAELRAETTTRTDLSLYKWNQAANLRNS
ncbi:MAG: hypothetical protein ACKOXB_08825 [Flavobacteriales bacterium]